MDDDELERALTQYSKAYPEKTDFIRLLVGRNFGPDAQTSIPITTIDGEPTKAGYGTFHYCPQVKGCPTSLFQKAVFPTLEVHSSYSGRSTVILSQGTGAENLWKAAFEDAVKKLAPHYGSARF